MHILILMQRNHSFILIVVCFLFVTILALLGYATTVIPHWFTHYVASGLFAVFGLKMLKEGQCAYLHPNSKYISLLFASCF